MDYSSASGLKPVMAEVNGIDSAWTGISSSPSSVLLNEEQRRPGVAKGKLLDLIPVVKSLAVLSGMIDTEVAAEVEVIESFLFTV